MESSLPKRKPEWLKVQGNTGETNMKVLELLNDLQLNTVCVEAGCPNCGECFQRKTATFLIMGNVCTRNCQFCQITKGRPQPLDKNEPLHVAKAVTTLQLRHVVITSVTRDDLPCGGASHFAETISAIREQTQKNPVTIEVLIPDFQGNDNALNTVINARPDIINHNIETIPRLYPKVRPNAIYERSLSLLKKVKQSDIPIISKSGVMVGLGESFDEMISVFHDLRKNDCDLLTVGQYLSPSKNHYPIAEYIHPSVFDEYRKYAEGIGFKYVASSPLVRSSYMAENAYNSILHKTD